MRPGIATCRRQFGQHRPDPHRHLLRTVHRDLRQRVLQCRVVEAHNQCLAIDAQLILADTLQRACCCLHQCPTPPSQVGVRNRLVDMHETTVQPGIGQHRMRPVQHPQLARLERGDVRDQPRTRSLPSRARPCKIIGDHPFRKAFGDNRRSGRQIHCGDPIRQVVWRARRDPVDHGVRECDL